MWKNSEKVLTELEIRLVVSRFLTSIMVNSQYRKIIFRKVGIIYPYLLPIIKYRHEISCWKSFNKGEILICIRSMSYLGRLILDIRLKEEEATQIKCRVLGNDDTLSEIGKQFNKLSNQYGPTCHTFLNGIVFV